MLKKATFLISFVLLNFIDSKAQKIALTDTAYKSWTTISNGTLSNNGKYVFFKINNDPKRGSTLVLKSTDLKWETHSARYVDPSFSEDSRFLFAMDKDTLIRIELNTRIVKRFPNQKNYQLFSDGSQEWLISLSTDELSTMRVENLLTGKTVLLNYVVGYIINKQGSSIIVNVKDQATDVLKWLDYRSGKSKTIYQGSYVQNIIFDKTGQGIAFATENNETQIHYYHKSLPYATILATDTSKGIKPGYCIRMNSVWRFSNDNKSIFFTQGRREIEKEAELSVWNYRDAILLSQYKTQYQGITKNNTRDIDTKTIGTNLSVINIEEKQVYQLLNGTKKIYENYQHQNDDVVVVESSFGDVAEGSWNAFANVSYYLCFTKTGELQSIKPNSSLRITAVELSPDNRYLVYFDPELANYISVNIKTRQEKIISKQIDESLYQYDAFNHGLNTNPPKTIPGWVLGKNQVILQAACNLWLVDLENSTPPVNLSKNINQSNEIIFNIGQETVDHIIKPNDEILIGGYNKNTKQYGVYSLCLVNLKLKQLFVANNWGFPYHLASDRFMKSKKSSCFLLKLESVSESANYFYTKDLVSLVPISNNYPEKSYNWIKSELIKYNDQLGNRYEGILYTPEIINHNLKYPLIINYYMEQSIKANSYIKPEPSNVGINIPYLVGNGYFVFIPSVYSLPGEPGKAVLNSVNAGVDFLVQRNLIDTTKMGVSGHSWGGFETNYIVSHSNRFKAAAAFSGTSNLIQSYNDLWSEGESKQGYVKGFMGEDLQNIPEKYIDNTPILNARKINTPLLLMHNENDTSVPVNQSIQFFVQLRSLKKPVWLLQYKGEGHSVRNEGKRLDLQDKVLRFFDYYLRGMDIPDWMDNPITPDTKF